MSSRDYGVDDYGLLLTQDTLEIIASKYCDDYTPEDFKEDTFSFIDELVDAFDLSYMSDFTGEAFKIDDDGYTEWVGIDSEAYNCDLLFYLPLQKYASLFRPSYNSLDEVVDEVKEKLGKYLPADFDYRNNIRHISGTYWSS